MEDHLLPSKGEEEKEQRDTCVFFMFIVTCCALRDSLQLDTDSFLNAFYHMTSRRGLPQEVMAGNVTNFVDAKIELKELINKLDKNKIEKSAANNGIKWHFNPLLGAYFLWC